MSLSNFTGITPIAERSDATPGLWNYRFGQIDDNFQSARAYLSNNQVFNVLDYAAPGVTINAGVNATQATAAFVAWAAAINAAGGGIGVIPPGSYPVTLTKATASETPTAVALCAFASLTGFTLYAGGATITDANSYGATEEAILFSFSTCTGVSIAGLKVSATSYSPTYGTQKGCIALLFRQTCAGVSVDMEMVGGLKAVFVNRDTAEPLSYTSSDFRLSIRATGTQYPLLCRFSGDNVVANIDAVLSGRNYYAIGCANHSVRVKSKNQTGATVIAAFSGLGCSNIELWYADTGSDSNVATSEAILLQWSDQTAAMHKNIRIHLDVNNPLSSPFSSTFAINKVNNFANTDVVGRGHTLDGLSIDGKSIQIAGVDHIHCFGTFVALSDTVRNVSLRDLVLLSGGVSNVHLGNLLAAQVDQPEFEHIYTDGSLLSAESFTITGATNATPIVVTTSAANDVFHSEGTAGAILAAIQVTIAGVTGNTNANGTYYAKRLTPTTFALYTDAGLTTGRAGSGAYVSGGSGYIAAVSAMKAVYVGCTATEVTGGITDQGTADYLSTVITTGAKISNTAKRYDGGTTVNTVPQPVTLPRMTATQRDAFPLAFAGHLTYNLTSGKVDVRDGAGWASLATQGTMIADDGTALLPGSRFTSEASLGFYRSAVSTVGLSYGAFALPAGSKTTPSLNYGSSESSLGWYRSGQATIAPSYGTLDLAPNAVRLSLRTLAASSITASAAQASVQPNEVVFTIGGASGASLVIMSGGTAYIFNSVLSAKQT